MGMFALIFLIPGPSGVDEVKSITECLHVQQFAGRNQRVVGIQIFVGNNRHLLVENIFRAIARQVEVRVIREIHNRVFVGRGLVINLHRVVFGQPIRGLRRKRAWVSGFAILAEIREFHAGTVRLLNFLGRPQLTAKSFGTTVQTVGPVVDRQVMLFAIQREFAAGNSVGVASHRCARS